MEHGQAALWSMTVGLLGSQKTLLTLGFPCSSDTPASHLLPGLKKTENDREEMTRISTFRGYNVDHQIKDLVKDLRMDSSHALLPDSFTDIHDLS